MPIWTAWEYRMKWKNTPRFLPSTRCRELGIKGSVCKNLFLRDAKGRQHFLVVLPGDRQADLGALAAALGSSKLSFASEERLMKHLGLTKGSVTPSQSYRIPTIPCRCCWTNR